MHVLEDFHGLIKTPILDIAIDHGSPSDGVSMGHCVEQLARGHGIRVARVGREERVKGGEVGDEVGFEEEGVELEGIREGVRGGVTGLEKGRE